MPKLFKTVSDQIAAIIKQLKQARHTACGWVSDGSMSKLVDNVRFAWAARSENGLRLHLVNMRTVNWRLSPSACDAILAAIA